MKKAVLYAHGGSGNHGCEALVRATSAFLKANGIDDITLVSRQPDEDKKYIPDFDGKIQQVGEQFSGITPSRVAAKLLKTVSGSTALYDKKEMKALFGVKDSLCFSIGGDNYCYDDYERYMRMNGYLVKNGNKTVLWGCSVSPERIALPQVAEDLKRYSLITARESMTYKAMLDIGLKNVILCPDPAFLLQPQKTELPSVFSGDTVGINVSPLVLGYEKNGGMIMKNYCNLIEHILADTDMNIALIPHVVWLLNDDTEPLGELFEKYKDTGRIALVDRSHGLNCRELKYVVSKCRFIVTARTHASVAAYSTGVPALVTGYSVKAKGIAADIFGSYDNYVCPVQELKNENDLTACFDFITAHEADMKAAQENYCRNAAAAFGAAAEKIKSLI